MKIATLARQLEKNLPVNISGTTRYVVLDITRPRELESFLSRHQRQRGLQPFLWHPAGASFQADEVVNTHIKWFKELESSGFSVGISAYFNGFFHEELSCGVYEKTIEERAKNFLCLCQKLPKKTKVMIPFEDLMPAGLDLLDGMFLFDSLKNMGFSSLMLAFGNEKFPVLYHRRATKEKGQNGTLKSLNPIFGGLSLINNQKDLNISMLLKSTDFACDEAVGQKFPLSELAFY